MNWTDVDGWLSPVEGLTLRWLAAFEDVLEIGSYKGRSTVCMAATATHVTALDWHKGDDGAGRGDTLAEFLANLEAFGVRDKVTPVVKRVEEAKFPAGSFGLVFVDDDHSEAACTLSTKLALSCVKPGGVIAWHDYWYPSVRAAVAACGLVPTGEAETLAWATV